MVSDPFVEWLQRNVYKKPPPNYTCHHFDAIQQGIPKEEVWNPANEIACEMTLTRVEEWERRKEKKRQAWRNQGRDNQKQDKSEEKGEKGEIKKEGKEEARTEEEEKKEVEENENVPLLSVLSAKIVASAFGTQPQKYAQTILNLPSELALLVIWHTSPTFVEALATLHRIQSTSIESEKRNMVNLMRMMYSIEEYEFQFLTFCKKFGTLPPSNSWSPPLIDIWQNYDTFFLEKFSEEENEIGKICFSKNPVDRPPNGQIHSVADEGTFKRRFAIFTENQFEGWNEWENMVVIGGAVVASLLPIPDKYENKEASYFHEVAYPTSDIDIYIYGLDIEEFAKKVDRIYHHFKKVNGEVLVVRTTFTISFCSSWPKRHIQIVIGKWNNIPEILFEPDIDCTCVAYDGVRVWATQRSRFSYNYRAIITSQKRYSVRGFPEYEGRLIKYSRRGFHIWDKMMAPDFANISLRYLQIGKHRITERLSIEGRTEVAGLRLLLIGYLWPQTMSTNNVRFFSTYKEEPFKFKDEGLPYGPNWNLKKTADHLEKNIKVETSYGVSEGESPYTLIKEVVDWQTIVSPHRDKLVDLYVELQSKDLSGNDGWRTLRRLRCCYWFHSKIFLEQDLLEVQNKNLTARCCKHIRRYVTTDKHDLYCPRQPSISAKALFLDRAGNIQSAEEEAQIVEINLEDYNDDPYSLGNFPLKAEPIETTHPLFRSVQRGDFGKFSELLESGYSINTRDEGGMTVMHYATKCHNPNVIRILARLGADVNAVNAVGMSPLQCACIAQALPDVYRTLLELGAQINATNDFGLTPLELIIQVPDYGERFAGFLIRRGASAQSAHGEGFMTPLHRACMEGYAVVESLLCAEDVDVNARCGDGMTPLFIAAGLGDCDVAHNLISAGAEIDAANDFGETPLMVACDKGHEHAVHMLVENGADACAVRNDGATPLTIASSKRFHIVVHHLIHTTKRGSKERQENEVLLGRSTSFFGGHLVVEVERKDDCDHPTFAKGRPLFEAAKNGILTEEMRALAPHWACVRGTISGKTPLQWAVFYGNVEMAAKLLASGAEVDYMGDEYTTPLTDAAKLGHTQFCALLLRYSANVEGKGERRKKARETTRRFHNGSIEFEEDNEEKEEDRYATPIWWAVQNGHAGVLELLLKKGANVKPYLISDVVQTQNAEILAIFVERYKREPKEEIPLHWAALNGWVEGAQILVKSGFSEVNSKCGDGMTPLHFAVLGGKVVMVEKLLEWGANVNEEMEGGMTSIQLAVQQGHEEMVKVLEKSGHGNKDA